MAISLKGLRGSAKVTFLKGELTKVYDAIRTARPDARMDKDIYVTFVDERGKQVAISVHDDSDRREVSFAVYVASDLKASYRDAEELIWQLTPRRN